MSALPAYAASLPLPLQHNADLADKAGQHQQLWEHFVLLGQFQGRQHRWAIAALLLGCSSAACGSPAPGCLWLTHTLVLRGHTHLSLVLPSACPPSMPPLCPPSIPPSLPSLLAFPPRRFSCPLQIGNSYRLGYVKARGQRCFDHSFYSTSNPDLEIAGLTKGAPLPGARWGLLLLVGLSPAMGRASQACLECEAVALAKGL